MQLQRIETCHRIRNPHGSIHVESVASHVHTYCLSAKVFLLSIVRAAVLVIVCVWSDCVWSDDVAALVVHLPLRRVGATAVCAAG